MKRILTAILVNLALMLAAATASAQSCSATATTINFGSVSPIRLQTSDMTGSISVTCTWPLVSLTPNAHICLSAGSGTASTSVNPRYLANGSNTMSFNLYTDSARSTIWGSVFNAASGSPIRVQLSKPLLGTRASTTVTYYGRINSNQSTVRVVGNTATTYTDAFSGNHTALSVVFNGTTNQNCGTVTASTFPFTAQAQVIDDCTINATNMNFPTTGVLNQPLQATSTLNVRCTNGNAWTISLNGGSSGNMLDRRMQGSVAGNQVKYQLYTTSARSIIWGDGTSGTAKATGTGTGLQQAVTVYGTVPAQATPVPGTYHDTIIATITF